tara:strand:+ start:1023 stop:1739 length:717 start_codon:yes stop_codon:yes gene_type:complete
MDKERQNTHFIELTRLSYRVSLFLLLSIFMNENIYSEVSKPMPLLKISILDVLNFNRNAWEEIRFHNLTDYTVIKAESGTVIRAESKDSASGLLLKEDIDITKTPYLNWSWKVEKTLPELPETTKSGDDYVARIYLIHSGGWFFWQTKALNYVWSSRNAKEQMWPNAYAPDNALMKAVRDKSDDTGIWYTEKRHVQADFKAWLEKDILQIEGIAIMTDTDDSKGHAVVYYGDIFFSAD